MFFFWGEGGGLMYCKLLKYLSLMCVNDVK